MGFVLMLPDAHAGCARLAVLPGRLLLMRRRIAAHRCSRSLILALRKATPTLEALIFGTNRRATFLQACVFARIIDAVHFFIISATLLFRRDQHNRTLVPYAFLAVSLAEMAQSEVEICLLPSCFHRPPWSLKNNASSSGRCVHRQIPSMPATNAGILICLARNGSPWICGGRSEEKAVLVRPKSNRRMALLVEMS